MRQTATYKFPLWDLADMIKRMDVNGIGEKAEAALTGLDMLFNTAVFQRSSGAALANRSGGTLTIPAAQVSGRTRIQTGSYTGNGATQVELRFPGMPQWVSIYGTSASGQAAYLILQRPLTSVSISVLRDWAFQVSPITWGSGGVSWGNSTDGGWCANISGKTYQYLAILDS